MVVLEDRQFLMGEVPLYSLDRCAFKLFDSRVLVHTLLDYMGTSRIRNNPPVGP